MVTITTLGRTSCPRIEVSRLLIWTPESWLWGLCLVHRVLTIRLDTGGFWKVLLGRLTLVKSGVNLGIQIVTF